MSQPPSPPSEPPSTSSNPKIQCQCGTISFHASLPAPVSVYCCHCLECQKQSGSAFGTSAIFPAAGMWPPPGSVMANLGKWTRATDSGNRSEAYFCKVCGVRVLHRIVLPDGRARAGLSVKGGCVEGLRWEGARHIFVRSARVSVPEGSAWGEPGGRVGMEALLEVEEEVGGMGPDEMR